MTKTSFRKALLTLCFLISTLFSVEGYYKDLFMDGGANLTSRTTLPAADTLGLQMEFLATSSSTFQNSIMVENDDDYNGYLLYPDSSPRFRVIYTNGGSATSHGNSLGETGRQRIRDYFGSGGCYTGSCAGAFITSISYQTSGIWTAYYHIWPGRTASTGVSGVETGHFIEPGAAILDYYDFGGDAYIDSIIHLGGCYARETIDWPPETEVQLRYDYPGSSMDDKPSCWAYKGADTTGRLVVIGSHPEGIESGERLDLMCAMILYALDGQGIVRVKGELANGIPRVMDRETIDLDPDHTKIGDLQYHHFTIDLPAGASNLTVELDGETGYDFDIFLRHGDFAFLGESDIMDTTEGAVKSLYIETPASGDWFVSVKLDTTIHAVNSVDDYYYSGAMELLNGLEYTITARWDTSAVGINDNRLAEDFLLLGNSPNPFNDATAVNFSMPYSGNVRIEIYSADGRLIDRIADGAFSSGNHSVVWNGRDSAGRQCPTGIYFYTIRTNRESHTGKMLMVK